MYPSTFWSIFFPLIHSIKMKNTLPPSNAGNGKALITARLMLKYAVKYRTFTKPTFIVSPTIEYIPTGPARLFSDSLPVNNEVIVNHMLDTIDPSLTNEYLTALKNPLCTSALAPIPNTFVSVPSSAFTVFGVTLYSLISPFCFFTVNV